ncbi:hypothetical protein HD_0052 [[Haemophilus] ducreyi 35000HP]|uniref:Uncharacterized protein n=1 Tax=Haemophilus ducreyi (strain 35000HP / ATCC 700724) TaxID=233412 RepID=Q7VPL2_HAEDU|nr:hypothetical protein HD_0052 [[Haemophilus] ducreyi 35000HP]
MYRIPSIAKMKKAVTFTKNFSKRTALFNDIL